ncbi:MAG: SoxR reducing system RseC family protein [Thermodesulfovibrionales bacterium]|nr:SoxR reducing system RseC family protein [Thermodesulfovibrionales bacterium]
MDETGIIKETKDGYATVSIIPQDMNCCEGCKGGALCKSSDGDERLIEALNPIGGKIGDRVKISFKPLSYISGIFLVYGIPCLMLVIGALIGKEILSPMMPTRDSEAISAGTGFLFFISSLLIIKLISNLSKKQNRPVIIAIIE